MIRPFIFQVLMITGVSPGHCLVAGRIFCLQHGAAVFAAVLMSLVSIETPAQDENETCPCFSYEEVEAILLEGQQLTAEEGVSSCHTEDYSVECNAEVVIWDQDYTLIAQARVEWFDFDSSRCEYIDTAGNPGVERSVSWPHPAPEAMARACFNIISSVIAKSDTAGKCDTYP
jgi:hypothetical protein